MKDFQPITRFPGEEQRGIRHHQQSVKGGLWRIDYQLTANEGGHKNTMEPLRRGGEEGNQVNFIVT